MPIFGILSRAMTMISGLSWWPAGPLALKGPCGKRIFGLWAAGYSSIKNRTWTNAEINYGFTKEAYDPCEGYWDQGLSWHPGPFDPFGSMVDLVVKNIKAIR